MSLMGDDGADALVLAIPRFFTTVIFYDIELDEARDKALESILT